MLEIYTEIQLEDISLKEIEVKDLLKDNL